MLTGDPRSQLPAVCQLYLVTRETGHHSNRPRLHRFLLEKTRTEDPQLQTVFCLRALWRTCKADMQPSKPALPYSHAKVNSPALLGLGHWSSHQQEAGSAFLLMPWGTGSPAPRASEPAPLCYSVKVQSPLSQVLQPGRDSHSSTAHMISRLALPTASRGEG